VSEVRADELAEFAAGLRVSDVPGPVRKVARDHILDTIGVSLACSGLPYMKTLERVSSPLAGAARVLGSATTYPAATAAFLTGSLSHGNDYDDSYVEGIVHPTGPALAAALAMSGKCTGADLLAAVVAGVEVTCRVAQAVGPAMLANGVHPTSACGVLGATAAAGRAAGLAADELANALALAAGTAGGLHQSTIDGSWNKRIHGGLAARAAVTCCELARAGMTAPRRVLEDGAWLFRTFGVADRDLRAVTADLGGRWEAAKTAIKVYPACQGVHPYVDCAITLHQQASTDDVQSIALRIGRKVGLLLCEPRAERLHPSNGMAAKFSLPYTVAYALRYGKLTEAAFDWRQPVSPAVLSLASRVTWEIDPHFDVGMAESGYVSVTTKAEGTTTAEQPNCRGSWQNPLGTAEVEAKFTDNVAGRLGAARAAALGTVVEDIESAPDLTELFDLGVIDAQSTVLVS
jgi:2-methylcitrate dehydratase PrpD